MSGKQISRLANSYLCWQKIPFPEGDKNAEQGRFEAGGRACFSPDRPYVKSLGKSSGINMCHRPVSIIGVVTVTDLSSNRLQGNKINR